MTTVPSGTDVADDVVRLHDDGITSRKGAFSREWADEMYVDVMHAFDEAIVRPHGAVGRGPHRYYVEIHPEQLRGFVDLVTHPWVVAVSEAVLGADYEIVELGFDVPFAGAVDQPWHRDFPSPPATYVERRLTSLAFNLTAVDTTADMGPFEISVGTQFLPGSEWKHQMFPDRQEWPDFAARASRRLPQRGDISARSALTVHRGTSNHSPHARPVLVLGVDAPGAGHSALHDMQVTHDYWQTLPPSVRAHLVARRVDHLTPVEQKHDIEGLEMGA